MENPGLVVARELRLDSNLSMASGLPPLANDVLHLDEEVVSANLGSA
jgi:hypothetical protein